MKTVLHYYYYDISDPEQKKQYDTLSAQLKAQGLKLFDSFSPNGSSFYDTMIKPLNGETIELETDFLFDNQWNSGPTKTNEKGLRVFDWAETIFFHNRNIKIGMYLDITPEMTAIRENTLTCGYCGKFYEKDTAPVFCEKCLDSEYLKEDNLYLLRLLPVSKSFNGERPQLTNEEKAVLLPQYVIRQTIGNDSRNAQKLKKQREKIEHDYQVDMSALKDEHDGLLWLMDHNVNIDNVIYYSHTGKFCFGWRTPLSTNIKSKLLDVLTEFPYDYELKEEKIA